LLLLVSLAFLAGATRASAQPGWRRFDIPATGAYVLRYLPASLPPGPAPVVVFLHGSGSSPDAWQSLLAPVAEANRVVLIVPKSVSNLAFGPGADDVTIAEGLRLTGEEVLLDPQEIYLAGHSAGGGYAAVLAYAGSLRVAAVFILSAPYQTVLALNDPDHTPPMLMVYGSNDPNYLGGSTSAYGQQWNRLGVPWQLTLNQGYGHSDWPPDTLDDGFAFLLAHRYTTPGGCLPSDTRLCLHDGRFAVEAQWATPNGASGPARATPARTPDSGLFWFFEPDNWELQVKVLDGCGLTGHFWVFAAASTNVEYTLTVTDLVARGAPATTTQAVRDVQALPCP
jgi:pimeloyl-ACP methyl ester carboxylesterase